MIHNKNESKNILLHYPGHMEYTPPVSKLLTLGECWRSKKFFDYANMGINENHVQELLVMLDDDKLHKSNRKDGWAPVHAWMALARMKSMEVVEPLLHIIQKYVDNDLYQEMIPNAFVVIGPDTLPYLESFIKDREISMWARMTGIEAIEKIGMEHLDSKKRCINILNNELASFHDYEPGIVTFLASSLVELGAMEAIANLRFAFMNGRIDPSMIGPYDEHVRLIMEKQAAGG